MARVAQIDNRQPAVGQPNSSVVGPILALVIRTAMAHGIAAKREPASRLNRRLRTDSHYAAHNFAVSLLRR
jgi:hypothetical protein